MSEGGVQEPVVIRSGGITAQYDVSAIASSMEEGRVKEPVVVRSDDNAGQSDVGATVSAMEEGGVQEPVVVRSGEITPQYDVSATVSSMEEGGVKEPVVLRSGGITAQYDVSATASSMEEGGVKEPVVVHSGRITAQYDVSATASSMEEGGVQEPVVVCSGGITAHSDVSENISSVELQFSVDEFVSPSDEDTMSNVIQFINPMKRCLEANSDVNFKSYFAAGVNLEYKPSLQVPTNAGFRPSAAVVDSEDESNDDSIGNADYNQPDKISESSGEESVEAEASTDSVSTSAAQSDISACSGGIKVICSGSSEYFDKRPYCYFCGEAQTIQRHWMTKHKDETEVIRLAALKDRSERIKYITTLRNKGNHFHNCDTIRAGKGDFLVTYKPKPGATADDYRPCVSCWCYLCG